MVDILKSNYKSIDNQLKSAEVIRPIKSINTGNSSHLMIKKASCHFHIVHYILSCFKSMSCGIISIIDNQKNFQRLIIPVFVYKPCIDK